MRLFLFLFTVLIGFGFQGDLQEKEMADFSLKLFNCFHYQEVDSFKKLMLQESELTEFVNSNENLSDREKKRFLDGYRKDLEKQKFDEQLLANFQAMMRAIDQKNLKGQLRFVQYNVSFYEAGMDHLYGGELVIEVNMGSKKDYIIVQIMKGPFGYRLYSDLYCKTLLK